MAPDTQRTRTLAQVAGPYLALVGLSVALRRESLVGLIHDLEKSPATVFFLGLVTLLIGLLMLVVHHSWRRPLDVAISLLGVLVTARGVILLAAPEVAAAAMHLAERYARLAWVGAIVAICLGGWLSYEGYFKNRTQPAETLPP